MIWICICNYAGGLTKVKPVYPKLWTMHHEKQDDCPCAACQSLPLDRPERQPYCLPVTYDNSLSHSEWRSVGQVREEIGQGHHIFPVRMWLK